ncbi:MAG TPA: HD-GYP domain-containing protein [Clostridiaceae bacterium]
MKLIFTRKLKGNEVLARNILSQEGKVLLKLGTIITSEYVKLIRNYGIFYIYVEEEKLSDISEDLELVELKNNVLTTLPEVFNNLLYCDSDEDKDNILRSLSSIEELITYISETGDVNTNLYEVKTYDNYTYVHCIDTCIMSIFLGSALKLNNEDLRILGMAAIFHDIGKTKVPQDITNKKGVLTEVEFKEMRNHSAYGVEILRMHPFFQKEIIEAVGEHHERYDGKGYPFGLQGENIYYLARIISICDVFTAVSANRSYRSRFNPNEAYELILSGSGTMFEPELVNLFRKTFAVYPLGCCLKLSNGIEAYVIRQNKGFPNRPVVRVIYDSVTGKPITPVYEIDLLKFNSVVVASIVI